MICSVRPSRERDPRESDGRLYTDIGLRELGRLFADHGAVILETVSSGHERAGTCWYTVVLEKPL